MVMNFSFLLLYKLVYFGSIMMHFVISSNTDPTSTNITVFHINFLLFSIFIYFLQSFLKTIIHFNNINIIIFIYNSNFFHIFILLYILYHIFSLSHFYIIILIDNNIIKNKNNQLKELEQLFK